MEQVLSEGQLRKTRSFELAKHVFHHPFAVEFLDDREDYDEERFVIIRAVEGRIL